MIKRPKLFKKLIQVKDTDVIKVITGARDVRVSQYS